jgi:EAL and modified HD-GYP domain-containing signal transduction protein
VLFVLSKAKDKNPITGERTIMQTCYIGRQPIFDRSKNVIGYELLYRQSDSLWAHIVDGDQATSQILLTSFWDLGLGKVVGPHRAFVNVTRQFLLNDEWLPPPSDQLVLEILEDILVDQPLIEAVRGLKNKGYQIALDDFIYRDECRPLIELSDIVKLDVQAVRGDQLLEHLEILKAYPLRLVAEKVETPELFDRCRELQFDYYQGYFLCKPRMLSSRRLPASRLGVIRLMLQLQTMPPNLGETERLISQDPKLSYNLLRYINSAAFHKSKKIDSIRRAIVYLGEKEIRRWASLILMTAINDKPSELVATSLIRGRMCELLWQRSGGKSAESAFLVGLFSVLDAITDQPLAEALESLPLSSDLAEALLHGKGPYADVLETTLAYERAEWDKLDRKAIPQDDITAAYVEAIDWAETTLETVRQTSS